MKILLQLMMLTHGLEVPEGVFMSTGIKIGGWLGDEYTVKDSEGEKAKEAGKSVKKHAWKMILHVPPVNIGYMFDILCMRIGPVFSTAFYQRADWKNDDLTLATNGGYSAISGLCMFDILNITFAVRLGVGMKWYDIKMAKDGKSKTIIYKDCSLSVALYRTERYMIFLGVAYYQNCMGIMLDFKKIW